jgi:hypothetical protein
MDHVWVIWELIILLRNVGLLVTWRTFILQFDPLLILITMVKKDWVCFYIFNIANVEDTRTRVIHIHRSSPISYNNNQTTVVVFGKNTNMHK